MHLGIYRALLHTTDNQSAANITVVTATIDSSVVGWYSAAKLKTKIELN
jgi:hypothetical protein